MRGGTIRLWIVVAVMGNVPTAVFAQDPVPDTAGSPARFGDRSQIAISSDAALLMQHASPADMTAIQIAPAADYFVIDELSFGGFVEFVYTKFGTTDTTRWGIGPRVGYNIPLSDLVSVWPKLGFRYSQINGAAGRGSGVLGLNLFVPIMLHPAQHFFVGFGPFLDTALSGDNKASIFGAKLTLGGWLDT